jgi:hypothetical protein
VPAAAAAVSEEHNTDRLIDNRQIAIKRCVTSWNANFLHFLVFALAPTLARRSAFCSSTSKEQE